MIDFPDASIHGRFQIIHTDHFAYLTRTLEKYGSVYIGLTGLAFHRARNGQERLDPDKNPLTYHERTAMWRSVLAANEIDAARVHIGPFPIEVPQSLPDFVPRDSICATTIREEWNHRKVEILRNCGYTVDILLEDFSKPLSSTAVRELIARGDRRWETLVPAGVAEFLARSGALNRLTRGRS